MNKGASYDKRVDVWSLLCVYYEMATCLQLNATKMDNEILARLSGETSRFTPQVQK